MLGLFGTSVIGTSGYTGPTSDTEEKSARFARHEMLRGKPVLQDLGNDAGTKRLQFFFDELFCDPEIELRKIERAFQTRVPMKLFFDLRGFEFGTFLIERLRIDRKKTTQKGRLTRVEIEVDLIESKITLGGLLGAALGAAGALSNPGLRRK